MPTQSSRVIYYLSNGELILALYVAEVIELAQNNWRSAAAFFDDGDNDGLWYVQQ